MIVTIDGADRTGKTTQIESLRTRNPGVVVVPPMMTFSDKWFSPYGRSAYEHSVDWWASDPSTAPYVIDAFVDAMTKRDAYKRAIAHDTIAFQDRGNLMLMCSLLAWLTMKNGGSLPDTQHQEIKDLFYVQGLLPDCSDLSILLVNGSDLNRGVANTMARVETDDLYFFNIYKQYQEIFHKYMRTYLTGHIIVDASDTENGVYDKIINTIRMGTNNQIVLL